MLSFSLFFIDLGSKNNFNGVFFSLGNNGRSRYGHEWANYVANKLGLVEGRDYTYKKRSLGTKDNPSHRKEITFELNNPIWTKIDIKRDYNPARDPLFFENVIRDIDISKLTEPNLIYEEGHTVGYLLEL